MALRDYINPTEKAGTVQVPAVKEQTSGKSRGLKSYYQPIQKDDAPYTAALGNGGKGLYAQAAEQEDNRDASFWEKVKNILGGTAAGAGKTYAADMANAYATMGQSLAEMNRISPIVGTMTTPADALWSREEQRAAQEKAYSAAQKWSDKVSEEGQQDIERAKSYTGKVGDTLIGAGVALGQMGADAAANLLLPGAGTALMAARVFGGNARGARQEGAGLLQQSLYGAGGAAASVLSGKLFGGAMGAYGKGTTDDLVEAIVSRATGSTAGRNLLRAVIKANGEGVEEVIEELVDPALQVIYKGNLEENYRDMDWGQVLESYIIGVISGGAAEAVSMTAGQYRAANEVLNDPGVQEAVEGFWKRTAENGTLSREAREQFRTMADTMEKARTEQNRTKAVENETRRIMRRTGMDEAYARAIAERRYGGEERSFAQDEGKQNEGGKNNEIISDAGQENGTDGDGAGGPAGVFSEAAEGPGAGERGDAGENGTGLGAGAEADVREVTPAELGISNGSREKTIQVVDADRAGGSVQEAAEEVRSIGMEPVAYRGEMIVGETPVWGYIENGKIYFRADAADSRGNAIDARKIVKHEMFHAAAEGDPELVESVKSAVTERMSADEFEGMKRAYLDAYSRVQDFSGWTEQEIADYLMQEITADAYAGLNYFSRAGEITEAARAAAPQVGQAQTGQSTQGTRGPPVGRAMVAGVNAKTADRERLRRAEEMEKAGTDNETIRQETGWYRGMDGKWRFEIDDSGAEFRRDGDAQLLKEEGYKRLDELTKKWEESFKNGGEFTEEDASEMDRLSDEYRDAVWEEKFLLRDFLKHDELFRAYPYLNRVSLVFDDLPYGLKGYFSRRDNTVVLSDKLFGKDADSLLHEIQHVIQKVEGFAGGANPDYWKNRIQSANSDYLKKKAEFQNDPKVSELSYKAYLDEDFPFDEELRSLMEKDPDVKNKYEAYRNAELFATRISMIGASPESLYRNTAGEIEARDTANRRSLTAEERKKTPPDLGDEDTVFAEQGGVVQLSAEDPEILHLKDQIREAKERLNAMAPVKVIETRQSFLGRVSDVRKFLADELKSQGKIISRKGFGDVLFDGDDIGRGLTYAKTPAERAAFLAVPAVIKRGIEIGHHAEHKGGRVNSEQGVESWTFAAPVIINGETGNLGVVVQRTNKSRYKAHKILMPDGSAFLLNEIKEAETGPAQGATENGRLVVPTDSASENTVPQDGAESKGNLSGRASVEVEPEKKEGTDTKPEERKLVRDRTVTLNRGGKKVEIEIRKSSKGWVFSVKAVGEKPVYDETLYDTPQEAARAALQAGEEYTMPEEERTRKALYEAADEATEAGTAEEAPPRGRYSQKEMELEEDRKRTLAEDAPWGAGARPVSEDADGNAAAEEFAQERAERAAEEDMAAAMEDFNKLLEDQLPVRDTAKPEEKVSSEVKKETEPRRKKWRDRWRSLMRTVVNAGDTIHRIARETGEKALDGYYFRALAARQTGTEWIAGKRHDILGRVTGKGLNEIFDPIRAKGKDYYEQFQLYLYHMHNIDRMSRDYEQYVREAREEVASLERVEPRLKDLADADLKRIAEGYTMDAQLAKDYIKARRNREKALNRTNKPVFGFDVTAEDSRAAVERLLEKHPEFTELAKDVYEYSDALLQYRVDAGLIKQADMDMLKKVYPHYVPTFRAQTNEQTKILHKGGLQVSKAIGRAVGGDGVLLPLHTALARQTMTVTKNGGINRLGMALLKARDDHGSVMREYITEVKEAENTFSEDTFDELEEMEPRKDNVITVIENGKRYDMKLDEGMTEAFKAFEPDKKANKAAYKFSKGMVDMFKKLCTAYNPLFSARNMIRDIQDAGLYSVDAKRWAVNYPKAWWQIWKNGKYWQQYVGLGGNYASVFDYAAGEARLDQKGLIGTIEKLNRWVEAAPRLAEFMTVIEKAEARGEVTEADLMTAFEAAQDVTTNFGRAGSLGKVANKYFVPFLNPSIQGADKFIRNLTERKGFKQWAQLVIRAAALGIAPAVINGLLHKEDEDWEKEWADISDATKANYYLLKMRDGVWLKIPRGRALAVLSTAGVALSETVKGDDIDPTELLEVISTNIAPQNPVEANIFKAWFDADLFNKDSRGKTWYGGTIENERMQSYRPGERYDSSTDKISKWLGGMLNLSPAKINYLLDQYSGVIGDMVLPMLTPQAESNPVLKAFTVDTVTQNKTSGEYYDAMDEMKWDMNGGDIAAGETFRYMNHANQTVSDYYAQIREIEADPELSDREKKEMTRALKSALTQYQKEILETAEKYRLAAEDYFDDHPELDYENERAVRAYMEQYNAMQEDEQYKKTESQIAAMMEAIVYREVNRDVLGAEYALETYGQSVYEKAQEANRSAGVSYDDYYDFYFGTKDMHADRDENGKSISGTKKAKVLGFIAGMDISNEQKDALAIAAGYKAGSWKSYKDGKTGGSGGRGGRSSKQKAVKIRETKVKLPDISSARANTIATRNWTGDETSAYEAIRKLTSGMRKKNPWYALPTGDPEIDEERPASARYFQTGKL